MPSELIRLRRTIATCPACQRDKRNHICAYHQDRREKIIDGAPVGPVGGVSCAIGDPSGKPYGIGGLPFSVSRKGGRPKLR